jgi:meso-butanediol dehydrogenase / (S,S)-butanediol dehydrogenase / diacetyl reductase
VRDLTEKTAFITGGGQGIGRGIALELARSGANLVVAQRNAGSAEPVVAEIRRLGRKALALPIDVSDAASIGKCIEQAFEVFVRIDILVNNAAATEPPSNVDAETSLADFDACYKVNLRGAWAVARALIPHFREHRSGKIINIASIAGRRGVMLPAYSASKAALINMTQSLATILGSDNINVNAVCPGPVWTPAQERALRLAVHRGEISAERVNENDFYKSYIESIALRRVATSQDIGFAVAFLASEEARNITGQALNVDGGMVMN